MHRAPYERLLCIAGVYMQEYFKAPNFPANMLSIWTRQWGHLLQHPRAGPAVVVGTLDKSAQAEQKQPNP